MSCGVKAILTLTCKIMNLLHVKGIIFRYLTDYALICHQNEPNKISILFLECLNPGLAFHGGQRYSGCKHLSRIPLSAAHQLLPCNFNEFFWVLMQNWSTTMNGSRHNSSLYYKILVYEANYQHAMAASHFIFTSVCRTNLSRNVQYMSNVEHHDISRLLGIKETSRSTIMKSVRIVRKKAILHNQMALKETLLILDKNKKRSFWKFE